jgi:hypothetical protein
MHAERADAEGAPVSAPTEARAMIAPGAETRTLSAPTPKHAP